MSLVAIPNWVVFMDRLKLMIPSKALILMPALLSEEFLRKRLSMNLRPLHVGTPIRMPNSIHHHYWIRGAEKI